MFVGYCCETVSVVCFICRLAADSCVTASFRLFSFRYDVLHYMNDGREAGVGGLQQVSLVR